MLVDLMLLLISNHRKGKILKIPIFATTQNRRVLGEMCVELDLEGVAQVQADKMRFSMCIPEILSSLGSKVRQVAIVGIESHICVLQTGLDLLRLGYQVYVLVDGVSSCNKEEIPLALRRLAREGAVITSSESFLYECMGDASIPEFKAIAALVKQTKDSTRNSLERLSKI